jgi:non-canonical (house-cleaning) NTP pyrophosphatase
MKLKIGSRNETKLRAMTEVCQEFSILRDAEIVSVAAAAPSLVSAQPVTLEETLRGAANRAKGSLTSSIHPLPYRKIKSSYNRKWL